MKKTSLERAPEQGHTGRRFRALLDSREVEKFVKLSRFEGQSGAARQWWYNQSLHHTKDIPVVSGVDELFADSIIHEARQMPL